MKHKSNRWKLKIDMQLKQETDQEISTTADIESHESKIIIIIIIALLV